MAWNYFANGFDGNTHKKRSDGKHYAAAVVYRWPTRENGIPNRDGKFSYHATFHSTTAAADRKRHKYAYGDIETKVVYTRREPVKSRAPKVQPA